MVSVVISLPSMKNRIVEEYCSPREHDMHSVHKLNNPKANMVLVLFISFDLLISVIKEFVLLYSKLVTNTDRANALEARAQLRTGEPMFPAQLYPD